MPTDRVDILIRARDAFSRVMGKATTQLKSIKISAAGVRSAFIAVTASLVGLTIALTKMFKIGAGALETQSKFNTVFGESAGKVDEFAKSFGKLAGLTRAQAQEQLATTGAIVQGLGFASDASAEFAQQVITLAGDLQSFNDVPIAETSLAIQSALTGERESLKRLGIVILDVDVKQKALELTGKRIAATLTSQEKATATLALITEKAGVAIGDLNRTQDSAANKARQVAGQFKQIAENVGKDMVPALASILPVLQRIGEAIEPIAAKFANFAIVLSDMAGLTDPSIRAGINAANLVAPQNLARARTSTQAAINRAQATIAQRPIGLKPTEQFALERRQADATEALIRLTATIDRLDQRIAAAAAAGRRGDVSVIPPVGVERAAAVSFAPGVLAGRVGTAGLGAAATRGGALANELAVFEQNARAAAEEVENMGAAVTDNFFAMAQAGIQGTEAMERQMVASMTSILQTVAGGGVLGAVIGGVGGLLSAALFGGRRGPTPVRIESYGSEALSQREREDFKQAIFIEIVSSIDDTTLAQFEYHLSRRQQLDGVPRIPVRLGG